jgi:hypothetical protein
MAAMLQLLVPEAVPEPPTEFVQVTDAMPTLSRAVPFTESELAEVEIVVRDGEVILSVGGDVLPAADPR